MSRESFLTVRWNNILSLALGVPAFAFIVFAFLTPLWATQTGLIGLSLIGVVY